MVGPALVETESATPGDAGGPTETVPVKSSFQTPIRSMSCIKASGGHDPFGKVTEIRER
jgi:hypothetical protein